MTNTMHVVSDTGLGRSFVLVFEPGQYQKYAASIAELLSAEVRAVCIESPLISDENWKAQSVALLEIVKGLSIRQATFVGFGAACALVQNTYLREPKIVRTMVLVNGSCRPHPNRFSSWIDALEELLPLGLPLRASSKGFDSRSHLQRIRCPVLVITLPDATDFLVKEAHLINKAMPTSWYQHLVGPDESSELCQLIKEFQEVPAKCPQKNLRAA